MLKWLIRLNICLNGRPEGASGSVVVCLVEGTRPLMVEVQALVCDSNFGMPRRTAAGTDYNRVNLLMAVLEQKKWGFIWLPVMPM